MRIKYGVSIKFSKEVADIILDEMVDHSPSGEIGNWFNTQDAENGAKSAADKIHDLIMDHWD